MIFAPTRSRRISSKSLRGFTLIELLVVIAIMAVMTSFAVASLGGGKATARLKGAARDIYAAIRLARSTALVTGEPCLITFATTKSGDEVSASVKVAGTRMLSTIAEDSYETLSGEEITDSRELVHIVKENDAIRSADGSDGDSLEDVLFTDIDEDVVNGVRIKVTVDEEELEIAHNNDNRSRHKISVFSNVDYLIGKYKASEEKKREATEAEKETEDESKKVVDDDQEPVSVAWQANGRCSRPHRIWIYSDGSDPDSGLVINVDKYGAIKVITADDEEALR